MVRGIEFSGKEAGVVEIGRNIEVFNAQVHIHTNAEVKIYITFRPMMDECILVSQ